MREAQSNSILHFRLYLSSRSQSDYKDAAYTRPAAWQFPIPQEKIATVAKQRIMGTFPYSYTSHSGPLLLTPGIGLSEAFGKWALNLLDV